MYCSYCRSDPSDPGDHTLAGIVTKDFLEFSKARGTLVDRTY